MAKLFHLLEPFDNITKTSIKREVTVAQVIPSILAINLFLNKAIKSKSFSGIITLVEELKKSVEKRLSKFLCDKSLCVATFLDLRFKLIFQHESDESVKNMVVEAWKEMHENLAPDSSADDDSRSGESEAEGSIFTSLMDCFKEIVASKSSYRKESESEKRKSHSSDDMIIVHKSKRLHTELHQEINKYISLPTLTSEDNDIPFNWWKNTTNSFMNLKKLAIKYLSAPPSSVESERIFRTGGNIYEATRNRLSPENGELLMFCHFNLRAYSNEV